MNTTNNNELFRALVALHGEVLEAVRRGYEAVYGRVDDAGERLRLITRDPLFAWVAPLTAAVAAFGEDEDLASAEVVERLLGGGDGGFAGPYRGLLAGSPEVAVAHGRVRAALRALRPARAA